MKFGGMWNWGRGCAVLAAFLLPFRTWAEPASTPAPDTPPPQEIKAPFGLLWGERPERLEKVLEGAKARVVDRRLAGSREMLTVEGIVQPGLQQTVFYFEQGGLNEVELRYRREDWDDARQLAWVEQIRRTAESKYGPGRVFLDEATSDNGVEGRAKGYEWVQNFASLRLVFFTAVKEDLKYRTVSLHYRGM